MSQNNDLTPSQAAEYRLNYPPGTRILLEHMDDQFAVPDGTRGTVDHVDDAGQIHMRWDNGRTLAIIPQVDSFRKLTKEELTQEHNMVIKVRGMGGQGTAADENSIPETQNTVGEVVYRV